MELLLSFGCFGLFLILGLVVGGMTERNHLADLASREQQLQDMLVTQLKSYPRAGTGSQPPRMLVSEVVIGSDYLKSFLAGLKNFFGGEVRGFRMLLDRARREAVLRIQEEAKELGYNAVCNIRLETADVGGRGSNHKNKIVMASILASGTAYYSATTAGASSEQ